MAGQHNFKRRSIEGVDVARFDCTDVAFQRHAHDEYVIGANVVGRERIWLDGRSYEASIDEATLYNPGEIQAATAHGQEWRFFSVYVDPDFVRAAMRDGLNSFRKPVVENAGLADRIRALSVMALDQRRTDQEMVEDVVSLLADTFRVRPSSADQRRAACPETIRTSERLMADIACPPRLFDLAAAENLTAVQLVRRFTAVHGMPPFTWLNMQRLKAARRLIANRLPLSDIALGLGFSDQAHFTRRFKAMYSVPPGVWSRGA